MIGESHPIERWMGWRLNGRDDFFSLSDKEE